MRGLSDEVFKRWAVVMTGILAFASVTFARDQDKANNHQGGCPYQKVRSY